MKKLTILLSVVIILSLASTISPKLSFAKKTPIPTNTVKRTLWEIRVYYVQPELSPAVLPAIGATVRNITTGEEQTAGLRGRVTLNVRRGDRIGGKLEVAGIGLFGGQRLGNPLFNEPPYQLGLKLGQNAGF